MLGWSTADIALGNLPKSDLETSVGDAAFNTAAGEFTGPVESAFGFHVIAVDDITPGTEVSLDDVRADITAALRLELATDAIYDSANELEDKLASGASLDQAITAVGGQIVTLRDIDQRGRDIDGEPIAGDAAEMAQDTLVIDVIWNANLDEISILQEGSDDMFFVVEVSEETDGRERRLDEVKARATADWQLVEAIRIARESAQALIDDEASFTDIEPSADFRRNGNGLDHEAARLIATAAFAQDTGSSTVVETGREAIALRTNGIIPADTEELATTTALVADFTANALQLDVLNTLARDLSQTHDLQIRLGSVQQLLVGNQDQ
jgi:peptidyl-prolyl cis-trans isomerase D